MKHIDYQVGVTPSISALAELYQNADSSWQAFDMQPSLRKRAIERSLMVVTAWHEDKLVGLIRCIGDETTICLVQDILVHRSYRQQGIGKTLLEKVLVRFDHRGNKMAMCHNLEDLVSFYQSCGFVALGEVCYCLPL